MSCTRTQFKNKIHLMGTPPCVSSAKLLFLCYASLHSNTPTVNKKHYRALNFPTHTETKKRW